MRTHQCKRCGAAYETDKSWSYFCPACALQAKRDTVVRQRICRQCGASFFGGPRASYCPSCRAERTKAVDKQRKKDGTKRPLGSEDICIRCGKPYIVTSGRQMYCPDCAEIAVREKTLPQKRAYAAANAEKQHSHRKAMLTGAKLCTVCGKPILTKTPTVTCSTECARVLSSYWQALADSKRHNRLPPDLQSIREKLNGKK